MNLFVGVGNVSNDPSIRDANGTKVARFSIALSRIGEGTDFLNCVAFGKTADHIENFVKKGMKLGIIGKVQTGSYTDKNGKKVYTTDIVVERTEFCERKQDSHSAATYDDNAFMPADDLDDGALPWN